jgi:ubiquinone/menaquinone biosynthesis C-methylase UbiE
MSDNQVQEEQKYAESTFDDVTNRYDKIEFFKISASHVVDLIAYNDQELEILDVASGTGNVVLECAKQMPKARFDAVDISAGMLDVAKEKAKAMNLENITFSLADITLLEMPKKYDVITCSYALFFLPEPIETLRILLAHLQKNGKLIFTTFTPKAFQPSMDILFKHLAIHNVHRPIKPKEREWMELQNIEDIHYLCQKSSDVVPQILTKSIRYDMTIEQWWALNNDAGVRGFLMQLNEEGYANVKASYYEEMQAISNEQGTLELVADTHYTVLIKS